MTHHDDDRIQVSRGPTPSDAREKFATQVNAELLAALRRLAKAEGRQLQDLIDEALADLLDKRRKARPRPHAMAAYEASHGAFAAVQEAGPVTDYPTVVEVLAIHEDRSSATAARRARETRALGQRPARAHPGHVKKTSRNTSPHEGKREVSSGKEKFLQRRAAPVRETGSVFRAR